MAPDTPEQPYGKPNKAAAGKPDDRSPDNARPTEVREPDNTRPPDEPTPRRAEQPRSVSDVENEGE